MTDDRTPADDELLGRMRAALDEAAGVTPTTAAPAERPADRRRWIAVAAAAVLVGGGVAAVAVNLSGSGTTPATVPVPGPDTELVGTVSIIDDGDGPQLAVELMASMPPQGGEIPLAGFDWSTVEGEQSMNGITWTDWLQVTGTWDGEAFTITRPPVPAEPGSTTTPQTPTPGCSVASASAAAEAIGALDRQALHLSSWGTDTLGGRCGAFALAWFDTQAVRDAIDGVRAAGHDVTVTHVFEPVDDPAPSTVPTSTTTSTTSDTTTTAEGAVWFEIRHPDFTPQMPELRRCCPPVPAPGPAFVMAWAATTGVDDGLLTLTATPAVGGTTDLAFEWSGMTDERAAELQAKVVPGSGLPYVLQDPTMELVGNGLSGMGELATQAYTEPDGHLVLRIGDYAGQLDWLTSYPSTPIDVLGRPGHRMSTEGGIVVLWQLANGDWAELLLNTAAAAATGDEPRFDAIMASLTPAPLPTFQVDVTTTTNGTATPTTDGSPETVYRGNASIIDNGDGVGPMLTFAFEDSLPPHGGYLPLAAFDWSMIEGEVSEGLVTWYSGVVGLVGTYDGTTFTLTEPPQPPFTFTDDLLTYGTLTEGCTDTDIAPMLDALQSLDHQALGIIESSDYRWDGHCGVQLMAFVDTPALRDAVSTLGDDVIVRIAFHPVET